MKKNILTLLLLCSFVSIHAVSSYKAGYIMTNSNDIVKGLIDSKSDKTNGMVCTFKTDLKAKEQTFQPGQIAGFRFSDTETGKFYVSRTVMINNSENHLFLEYLLQGTMNLYYYQGKTENDSYYFFEKEKGKLIPFSKDKNQVAKNEEAINEILKNYATLKKEALEKKATHQNMISLAKTYHNLANTNGQKAIEFEKEEEEVAETAKINFTIYGGAYYSDFFTKYSVDDSNPYKNILSPIIGGQFSLSGPEGFKSFSLVVDMSLTKLQYNETHDYQNESKNLFFLTLDGSGSSDYLKYSFGRKIDYLNRSYQAIQFSGSVGFKYTLLVSKFQPTVEAGLDTYYSFSEKNQLYVELPALGSLPAKNQIIDWAGEKKIHAGTYVGIGLNYKYSNKHSIRLNVDRKFRKEVSAWQGTLGYTF